MAFSCCGTGSTPGAGTWKKRSGTSRSSSFCWKSPAEPISRRDEEFRRNKQMAKLAIPAEDRALHEQQAINDYLAGIGIDYERWDTSRPVSADAPPEEVLAAYADEIDRLKAQGGYVTAD